MFIFSLFIGIGVVLTANLLENDLIPVDLDICKPLPPQVEVYGSIDSFKVYDIKAAFLETHKIANVLDNSNLVYSDSDILVYRRVNFRFRKSDETFFLVIYSKYKGVSGEFREVTEFSRSPQKPYYSEIIRVPLRLNLEPGTLVPKGIRVFYKNSKSIFRVSRPSRDRLMIGLVTFGDIVVDDSINGVNYKEVVIYKNISRNKEMKVEKRTSDGRDISFKCEFLKNQDGTYTYRIFDKREAFIF